MGANGQLIGFMVHQAVCVSAHNAGRMLFKMKVLINGKKSGAASRIGSVGYVRNIPELSGPGHKGANSVFRFCAVNGSRSGKGRYHTGNIYKAFFLVFHGSSSLSQ